MSPMYIDREHVPHAVIWNRDISAARLILYKGTMLLFMHLLLKNI